ncbi:ATP-dependent Clp protease adaptor ClpS [Sulfurimonas sp.]|nr:ATP-dependent Clp protease adaptor ClpS [Sulfurimonas sp.]
MPIKIKPHVDLKLFEPKMYLVTIVYDKHVSWEFCVKILMGVFHWNEENAKAIAHEIVTNGEGICGGYMLEIAESKAELVEQQAKKEGFSLYCLVEEV